MTDNNTTQNDFSNLLLEVLLLVIGFLILIFGDLYKASTLTVSTIILLLALFRAKKKYRSPDANQSAPNKPSGSWKWFIAAVGFLPVGIVGGLMLNYFFPDNPVSIIFMVVSGIFSVCLLMLKKDRSHD